MAKVTLNKSTKIKGQGLVLAGIEIEVTEAQKKDLEKNGFLGEVKKDLSPGNDKEIAALVKKVADLEALIEQSKDSETIESLRTTVDQNEEEIEALIKENEALKKELVEALEGNDNLLGSPEKTPTQEPEQTPEPKTNAPKTGAKPRAGKAK